MHFLFDPDQGFQLQAIKAVTGLLEGYGLSKFIIVVPSVAIREGVLKRDGITRTSRKEHRMV